MRKFFPSTIQTPADDVVSEDTFFTDFSAETVGQLPSFLLKLWNPGATNATTEELAGATGGKVFRVANVSSSNRHLWVFENLGDQLDDVEIVGRVRSNIMQEWIFAIVHRASGTSASRTGFGGHVNTNNNNYGVNQIVDGSFSFGNKFNLSTPYSANTWTYLAHRHIGSDLYIKAWIEGDTEPAYQQITNITTTTPASGYIGVGGVGNRVVEWDWVGIGLNGQEAPRS